MLQPLPCHWQAGSAQAGHKCQAAVAVAAQQQGLAPPTHPRPAGHHLPELPPAQQDDAAASAVAVRWWLICMAHGTAGAATATADAA